MVDFASDRHRLQDGRVVGLTTDYFSALSLTVSCVFGSIVILLCFFHKIIFNLVVFVRSC